MTSTPVQVRAEGLTERLGDINLQCSGAVPGSTFSGNLALFLPVSVSNRIDAGNLSRDAVISVDLGGGFVPTGIAGLVSGNSISFNGVSYTVPASGNINLRISNVRAAMNQLGLTSTVPAQITGSLSTSLAIDQSQIVLAYSQAGLLTSLSDTQINCYGSPIPATLDLPSLFAAGTAFASTRVTEGFATAFEARAAGTDSGTRFLVKYSGFPAAAHLYIPDAVAGSDALQPTSGGDLNLPQSIGQYLPGSTALFLVRIPDADATGAGGSGLAVPLAVGPVTLGTVSEVLLTNGAGYAVYEVYTANPSVQETAQFPTFIALQRNSPPAVAQESISLAPVSAVTTASATAPIPRFAAVPMQSDCQLFGDCAAPVAHNPKLTLEATPIFKTAVAGGTSTAVGSFNIRNVGGGAMDWSISVIYQSGTGWLAFNPPSGTNDATVQVTVDPKTLTAGISQATVIVNAGAAGSFSVPVVLTVTAPPAPPPVLPSISQVWNAASLQVAPLVPGSLATIMGSHFSGKLVAVTFDGIPATLIYQSDTQINLQVPATLGAASSTTLVVTVDGVSSAAQAVPLAAAWPAIFAHGVFNQDNRENTTAAAAKSGDILQIFATGIPKLATYSAQIADRGALVPVYAGEAPTAPGVQQVNVAVPAGLSGRLDLKVCATVAGQQYCSPAYPITVQ